MIPEWISGVLHAALPNLTEPQRELIAQRLVDAMPRDRVLLATRASIAAELRAKLDILPAGAVVDDLARNVAQAALGELEVA